MSTYSFNGSGMRTSKTVNGTTVKQVWDGMNIAAETDGNGTVTAKYYRGMSLISEDRSGTVSYYQFNGHGDVTGMTDTGGTVTASYQYDAFGVEINPNQTDTNPFRYCGEYFDQETNNIYLRNRYYSPSNGRFLTEDPIKDGTNWYSYCSNNSVMFIDPFGLASYVIYQTGVKSGDGEHTFDDEAWIRKAQLEEEWGTEVYLIPVTSAQDFKEKWRTRIGYDNDGYDVSIEEVVIIAHGSIADEGGPYSGDSPQGYIYFEANETNNYQKSVIFSYSNVGDGNDTTVWNLAWKEMQVLNFSTCNSGNPDVYNIAYAFKKRMTVNDFIVAWDGGTVFNYSTNQLEPGGEGKFPPLTIPLYQTTWYKYVEKYPRTGEPKREKIGYRQISGS